MNVFQRIGAALKAAKDSVIAEARDNPAAVALVVITLLAITVAAVTNIAS